MAVQSLAGHPAAHRRRPAPPRSKAYVGSDANMDFLRDAVARAPDLAPGGADGEAAPKPKRARRAPDRSLGEPRRSDSRGMPTALTEGG
jgi:hypothetical protein